MTLLDFAMLMTGWFFGCSLVFLFRVLMPKKRTPTNVDVLCVDCARRAQLCKHCGADIDLKNRRKRTLPTEDTE